jgi:hypothetical protein
LFVESIKTEAPDSQPNMLLHQLFVFRRHGHQAARGQFDFGHLIHILFSVEIFVLRTGWSPRGKVPCTE